MSEDNRPVHDSSGPENQGDVLLNYMPKLFRLVEKNMTNRLKQKEGPDDVVASVMRSLIRMQSEGKLHIEESDVFWRLLVVIALNKVRKKARFYKAKKRDSGREIPISEGMPQLEDLAVSHDLTDEEGEVMGKMIETLAERLDEDSRFVLNGLIAGQAKLDLASELGKSTRTVNRCCQKIEEELRNMAAEDIGD